jgi:hypothetical protein
VPSSKELELEMGLLPSPRQGGRWRTTPALENGERVLFLGPHATPVSLETELVH